MRSARDLSDIGAIRGMGSQFSNAQHLDTAREFRRRDREMAFREIRERHRTLADKRLHLASCRLLVARHGLLQGCGVRIQP